MILRHFIIISHLTTPSHLANSNDFYFGDLDKDLEKANQVALSRMLMGVHYPSDNEASISLAKQIYSSIKTEWFKDEV